MARSLVRLVAATGAAVMLLAVLAPPADAKIAVWIGRVQYDSPGPDTRSNASVNGEYVTLKNLMTTTDIDLQGFSIRDRQNNVYRFADNLVLRPGKTVKIHTGKGTNTKTDRYWGRTSHVWGNAADTVFVRNSYDVYLWKCKWTSPGPGFKKCQ